MKNTSPFKVLFPLLSISILLTLSACGFGSQVDIVKDVTEQITYEDEFFVEDAIEILKKSKSENFKEAIISINGFASKNFHWYGLMQKLIRSEEAKLQFIDEQKKILLTEWAKNSNTDQDWQAFVHASIVWKIDFDWPIYASKNNIRHPLGTQNIIGLLAQYNTQNKQLNFTNKSKIKTKHKKITEAVIYEYRVSNGILNRNNHVSWKRVFDSLPGAEWSLLAQDLIEQNESSLLLSIVAIQKQSLGYVLFENGIFTQLLHSAEALQTVINKLGYEFVLELFAKLDRFDLSQIKSEVLIEILSVLSDEFGIQNWGGLENDFYSRWRIAERQLYYLKSLMVELTKNVPFSFQLHWLDKLHRTLLRDFQYDTNLAINFLEEVRNRSNPRTELDFLWMSVRMNSFIDRKLDISKIESARRHFGLESLLASRLNLHHSKTPENEIKHHCTLLQTLGIKKVRLKFSEFVKSIESNGGRDLPLGCIRITHIPHTKNDVTIRTKERIQIPSDTIIQYNGPSLHIIANRGIDASIFDFSAAQSSLPANLEKTPVNDNALVFPVIIGLKIKDPDRFKNHGQGIYYLVFHYVAQKAKKGRPASIKPKGGDNGSNLVLESKIKNGNFPPLFISEGGPGQNATSPLPGGKGMSSELDLDDYAEWKADLVLNHLSEQAKIKDKRKLRVFKTSRPEFGFESPSFGHLSLILKTAEIGDDYKLKVYIPPRLSDAIGEDNMKRIEQLAKKEAPVLSFKAYVKSILGPMIAKQLEAISSFQINSEEQHEIHAQLRLTKYIERSGAPGPENFTGLRGQNGSMVLKHFSQNENK